MTIRNDKQRKITEYWIKFFRSAEERVGPELEFGEEIRRALKGQRETLEAELAEYDEKHGGEG